MTKDYELTTCGLSCDLCDSNTTKLQDAVKYLGKVFEDPMFIDIISMTNPQYKRENFSGFIDTLEVLKNFPPCPGCQQRIECAINQCAKQKSIKSCSECEHIDLEAGICKEIPSQTEKSMMPPAPIFFQTLSRRYQNWNIENLTALSKNQKELINSKIENMIKEGKSNRDIIDFSVSFFCKST